MKIVIVVGARPNFMKAAPVIAAINARNGELLRDSAEGHYTASEPIRSILVHTGQHYDQLMSDRFFADLDLPQPDVHLGVGSASHAVQTAEIMKGFEQVLLHEKPDVVIVVGDVNSALACALVTAKISFDSTGARPVLAHIEAGLRSFDRSMPEEINRIVTDHLSDFLFVTEQSGVRNLDKEGISPEKIHLVGNTMIDSVLACKEKAEASAVLDALGLRNGAGHHGSPGSTQPYALLTLHRPSNVDDREAFLNIVGGLDELALELSIIFPVHPRTQKRIREFGLEHLFDSRHLHSGSSLADSKRPSSVIRLIEPLGYLDFLCLMKQASLVVTDSGGIQEETTCLGVPCVTVRKNTERPATVTSGTNVVAGVRKEEIREATKHQMQARLSAAVPEKWDGHAAERIVEILGRNFLGNQLR